MKPKNFALPALPGYSRIPTVPSRFKWLVLTLGIAIYAAACFGMMWGALYLLGVPA